MSEEMNERFRYFYEDKGFGPAEHVKAASPRTVEKYRGKLPDAMLTYWQTYGFCSFGKGLFWTVDPDEYADLVNLWLEGTGLLSRDTFYAIAQTAFGELFLWGVHSGQSIKIFSARGMIFPTFDPTPLDRDQANKKIHSFFGLTRKDELDQKDIRRQPLFDRALKSLGQLGPGEMYGFEPALALGGPATLEHLRRVDAVTHLTFLAQLGERKLMRDIVQDARNAGLMK